MTAGLVWVVRSLLILFVSLATVAVLSGSAAALPLVAGTSSPIYDAPAKDAVDRVVSSAVAAADSSGLATVTGPSGPAAVVYDWRHSFVAPSSALDDGVTLINGRRPINSSYAGRVYDGAGWTDDLAARYPGGVRFNDAGFPDFSPYARARIQSDNLTGVYRTDAAAANRAVGLPRTPSSFVWPHVEDGRTMILIPQDIHDVVRHTGGAAVIRGGG